MIDKVLVLMLAALASFAFSNPQQALERRPAALQRQQSHGNAEGRRQEFYYGRSAEAGEVGEGPRRRRASAATSILAAKQRQHLSRDQQEHQRQGEATSGESTAVVAAAAAAASTATITATSAAGAAESRTDSAPADIGEKGILQTANGVRGAGELLEGPIARAMQAKGGETSGVIKENEQGDGNGGGVEAVEAAGAEEDKGIEEGKAGGFVVMAPDDKPDEGGPEDSLDNDNGSTSGISNNIMVIVFCALAFVANGGFLVYVFWVM